MNESKQEYLSKMNTDKNTQANISVTKVADTNA